ncbi:hypothetical protein BVC80_521g115 [Macleaya cordata]|uniref:TOG domain-containing protein n=1 Tax=Macleaya cordata TaxID=56857 RepID=A0A200R9B2_MACCD|nr:hypothetical protein BVC80_521g115 [Macleaya cordata]
MKTHTHLKAKGTIRANPQQVIFELKHRVIHTLNKLADRDTYQLGVEELEKTAESLTPEGVPPFISCIIDTDSGQKSAVRKECVRVMGTLARFHEGLLGPHLGKMVASIVKRLKDPDSVVRDACVEVVGVLASKMSNYGGESDGAFVLLVKPLFEALGEQNKVVQCGSALCLASVIDNANDPPVSILSRMLIRIIKFLKNPHFMAKPAVIDLVRSIIQAGGASTQNALSAAMASIQEALKSSDWATRKAASVALAGIVVSGGSLLLSFKASSIRSLESCRFDKVKPVRDSVSQALQCWKSLPGSDSTDPSEAGSSTKENLCGGDYSDLTSASDGGWKDVASKNIGTGTVKKRVPLTARRMCPNNVQSPQSSKTNDWEIQIAVPKTCAINLMETQNEESEGSCLTKAFERRNEDATEMQDIRYDYVPTDDKSECSMSNLVGGKFETKHVTHDFLEQGALVKPMGRNQQSAGEEVDLNRRICQERLQGRQSLDSAITEVSSQVVHGCCSQTANEMAFIQKQLSEIENKQSNLMDLLQVFMGSTMDSLSMLQSKVLGLEHAVDRIAEDLVQKTNYSNMASSKIIKSNQSVSSSPRLSTCTPRPSMDMNNRRSSRLSMKNREVWEDSVFSECRSSTSEKQGVEMRRDHTLKVTSNPAAKSIKPSFVSEPKNASFHTRKVEDTISTSACNANARQHSFGSKNNLWKRVKDYVCNGDLDSAFAEVLRSGDDLTLIELLDRMDPALERLSHETVSEILSTLASHFLDQRYLGSIIPWLQQVVDLSSTYGPDYLVLPAKAKREFLSAIQEAATMDFPNPADRRSVTQLALKLRQVWGEPQTT